MKIPSVFDLREDADGQLPAHPQVTTGCEWVIEGKGKAFRKMDGIAVMVRDGAPYSRMKLRAGRPVPADWIDVEEADHTTGTVAAWAPLDLLHYGQLFLQRDKLTDGMYELIGPMVRGNPEYVEECQLIPQNSIELPDAPRKYEAIREYLECKPYAGIVWVREDGALAQVRRTDLRVMYVGEEIPTAAMGRVAAPVSQPPVASTPPAPSGAGETATPPTVNKKKRKEDKVEVPGSEAIPGTGGPDRGDDRSPVPG
jgi:hypothetical protein